MLCIVAPAFVDYDMSEDAPTYVALYGLNQPYVGRIWAVTSQGRVEKVHTNLPHQISCLAGHGHGIRSATGINMDDEKEYSGLLEEE